MIPHTYGQKQPKAWLPACRAEQAEPTGSSTAAAKRVAVKRIVGTDLADKQEWVQQEAYALETLSGRPYAVDYHGLFRSSTVVPASNRNAEAVKPCAYLLMG